MFFIYMYAEHHPFRWQANLPARNFRQDDDEGDEMTWDDRLRMCSYNV